MTRGSTTRWFLSVISAVKATIIFVAKWSAILIGAYVAYVVLQSMLPTDKFEKINLSIVGLAACSWLALYNLARSFDAEQEKTRQRILELEYKIDDLRRDIQSR